MVSGFTYCNDYCGASAKVLEEAGFSRGLLLNKRVLNAPPGTSVLPALHPYYPSVGGAAVDPNISLDFRFHKHSSPVTCTAGDLYYFPASLLKSSTVREKKAPSESKPPKCVPTAPPQTHHTTVTLHAVNTPTFSTALRPCGLFSHL